MYHGKIYGKENLFDFLAYDIYYANATDSELAYLDIYKDLITQNNDKKIENILSLKPIFQKFAFECLNESAKKNNIIAVEYLLNHYKKGIYVKYNKEKIDSLNMIISNHDKKFKHGINRE